MLIAMIEGHNRICGKSQGYNGLPIRDETVDGFNLMHTAWTPTPDELKCLNTGFIYVSFLASSPIPPMLLNCERVGFDNGLDTIRKTIFDHDINKWVQQTIMAFKANDQCIADLHSGKNLICTMFGLSPHPMNIFIK